MQMKNGDRLIFALLKEVIIMASRPCRSGILTPPAASTRPTKVGLKKRVSNNGVSNIGSRTNCFFTSNLPIYPLILSSYFMSLILVVQVA